MDFLGKKARPQDRPGRLAACTSALQNLALIADIGRELGGSQPRAVLNGLLKDDAGWNGSNVRLERQLARVWPAGAVQNRRNLLIPGVCRGLFTVDKSLSAGTDCASSSMSTGFVSRTVILLTWTCDYIPLPITINWDSGDEIGYLGNVRPGEVGHIS